jgi:hypothetical protein
MSIILQSVNVKTSNWCVKYLSIKLNGKKICTYLSKYNTKGRRLTQNKSFLVVIFLKVYFLFYNLECHARYLIKYPNVLFKFCFFFASEIDINPLNLISDICEYVMRNFKLSRLFTGKFSSDWLMLPFPTFLTVKLTFLFS